MAGALSLGTAGLLSPVVEEASAEVRNPDLVATTVISDLEAPANVDFDDQGNIFIAQRHGVVLRHDEQGGSPQTVIDLRNEVYRHGDHGLLGMTLDPDFDRGRPYLYLLYTYDTDPFGEDVSVPRWGGRNLNDPCPENPGGGVDGCTSSGKLARWTIGRDGVAEADSEVVLIDGSERGRGGGWCFQYSSHGTAAVVFGPDGMLYVGAGDGASFGASDWGQRGGSLPNSQTPVNPCNDRPAERGSAPDKQQAAGGVLRAQSVRTAQADDYVSYDGAILRLDPDTGEAAADNPLIDNGIDNDDPIVAYGLRNPNRFSFRPGTEELWIGDIGSSTEEEINRFTTGAQQQSVPNFGWPCYEGPGQMGRYAGERLGLCESLYADSEQSLGGVQSPLVPPVHSWRRDQPYPEGCRTSGSSSVNGGTFLNDDRWPADLQGSLIFADMGRRCLMSMQVDADGTPDPASVQVIQDDIRPTAIHTGPDGAIWFTDSVNRSLVRLAPAPKEPEVTISSSAEESGWAVEDTVRFEAEGLDGDGRPLSEDAYAWEIELVQCSDAEAEDCTTSPAEQVQTEGAVASVPGPDVAYYAYLQATVTVTDQGLSASATTEAHPRLSTVELDTDPSGLEVDLGQQTGSSVQRAQFLENATVELSVPERAELDGDEWEFNGWSDGSGAGTERTVRAPSGGGGFTATYSEVEQQVQTDISQVTVSPTRIRLPLWGIRQVTVTGRVDSTEPVDRVQAQIDSGRWSNDLRMYRIEGDQRSGVYRADFWVLGAGPRTHDITITATSGGRTVTAEGERVTVSNCLVFC